MKMIKRIIFISILIVAVLVVVVFGSFLIAKRTMIKVKSPGEVCIGRDIVFSKSTYFTPFSCAQEQHWQPCWVFRTVSAQSLNKCYISFMGKYLRTSFECNPPNPGTYGLGRTWMFLGWNGNGNGLGYLTYKQYLILAKTYFEQHPINGIELNQYNFKANLNFDRRYATILIPYGKKLTQAERDIVCVRVWQKEEYWQATTNIFYSNMLYSASELSVIMTKNGKVLDAAIVACERTKAEDRGQ